MRASFPNRRLLPLWKVLARAIGAIMYVTIVVAISQMIGHWSSVRIVGSSSPVTIVGAFSVIGAVGLTGMFGIWGHLAERAIGADEWRPAEAGRGPYGLWKAVRLLVPLAAAGGTWIVARSLSPDSLSLLAIIVLTTAALEVVEELLRRRLGAASS